jgi:peptidoglycan/LPS O-acetylase OafA/YrhL
MVAPGAFGVELFFVLSGMLITGILRDVKDQQNALRTFYVRRVLRIFPLYYGTLFFLFAILPLFITFDAGANRVAERQGWLWAHLANFPAAGWVWDDSSLFLVGHFWSLAVEEHFYLVWPWIIMYTPNRTHVFACAVLLLCGVGSRFANSFLGEAAPEILSWTTLTKIDGLATGSLIAIALRDKKWVQLIPTGRLFRFLLLAAACGFLAFFLLPRRWQGGYTPVAKESVAAFLFGLILLACLKLREGDASHRIITSRFLTSFGKYSYGIYVIHGVLRPLFLRVFDFVHYPVLSKTPLLALGLYYVAATSASFLLAYMSYQLFERHWLSLKRFFKY